jgi:hypothetical protein
MSNFFGANLADGRNDMTAKTRQQLQPQPVPLADDALDKAAGGHESLDFNYGKIKVPLSRSGDPDQPIITGRLY